MTTKPWSLAQALDRYPQHGISGISIWREHLEGLPLAQAQRMLDDSGLTPVSLVRGGFLPSTTPENRQAAIDLNLRCIEEAEALGLPLIVLVCGADPAQSVATNLGQIREGIEAILPAAQAAGVKLVIEPLHPVYAPSKSTINTLRCANDMAESINHPSLAIAWDVYHLWWDHELKEQTRRCAAAGHLAAYHICDYKENPTDPLQDRGLPGEGVADLRELNQLVRGDCGFNGPIEIEIFSAHWWKQDQDEFVRAILKSVQETYGN